MPESNRVRGSGMGVVSLLLRADGPGETAACRRLPALL